MADLRIYMYGVSTAVTIEGDCRESEASPGELSREKRIEDSRLRFLVHSRPVILHFREDKVARFGLDRVLRSVRPARNFRYSVNTGTTPAALMDSTALITTFIAICWIYLGSASHHLSTQRTTSGGTASWESPLNLS